jgi:hypothetical protein
LASSLIEPFSILNIGMHPPGPAVGRAAGNMDWPV